MCVSVLCVSVSMCTYMYCASLSNSDGIEGIFSREFGARFQDIDHLVVSSGHVTTNRDHVSVM